MQIFPEVRRAAGQGMSANSQKAGVVREWGKRKSRKSRRNLNRLTNQDMQAGGDRKNIHHQKTFPPMVRGSIGKLNLRHAT